MKPYNGRVPSDVSPPDAKPDPPARDTWIEIFRGIAILAVVLIHTLPRFYRMQVIGSPKWWEIYTIHRMMFFAVPGFLMLSAIVNTRSLIRKPALEPYFRSRAGSILWPYLLWSAIYLAYQRWFTHIGFSVYNVPGVLLWGRAWVHFYFFTVLIQAIIVLPAVVALLRLRQTRPPRPFWAFLLGASALAVGAYFTNRYCLYPKFNMVHPGSLLIWYIPALAIGVFLGGEGSGVDRRLRQAFVPSLIAAVLTGYVYRDLASREILKLPQNTMTSQFAEWAYTSFAALALLGLSVVIGNTAPRSRAMAWPAKVLEFLGRYSFPIYLAHPFVLIFLDPHAPDFLRRFGTAAWFLLLLASVLGAPILLAILADTTRLSQFLFGRASPARKKRTPAPSPAAEP